MGAFWASIAGEGFSTLVHAGPTWAVCSPQAAPNASPTAPCCAYSATLGATHRRLCQCSQQVTKPRNTRIMPGLCVAALSVCVVPARPLSCSRHRILCDCVAPGSRAVCAHTSVGHGCRQAQLRHRAAQQGRQEVELIEYLRCCLVGCFLIYFGFHMRQEVEVIGEGLAAARFSWPEQPTSMLHPCTRWVLEPCSPSQSWRRAPWAGTLHCNHQTGEGD